MKKTLILTFALTILSFFTKAQTTALQFTGVDCNGGNIDLYADLDAGKAVVLFFYMPSCGSCPPPAQKIQAMANNINAKYPGKVKGYAFPFQNSTTCTYSSTWVSSNNLSTIYLPMDSGEVHVSHYGGFGMPTVALVGGSDHKVLFSTLNFNTSDTTIMRDKIFKLLGVSGINNLSSNLASFKMYPNPATNQINLNIELNTPSNIIAELFDITGKQVAEMLNINQTGSINAVYNIEAIPTGLYFVKLLVNEKVITQKINIQH